MAIATPEMFAAPRTQVDIDLVTCITQTLQKHNHGCPAAWLEDPIIIEAADKNPLVQRFLINRYWRAKLGICPVNSTKERFCLVDTGDDRVYLQIFDKAVAPFIVKNNL